MDFIYIRSFFVYNFLNNIIYIFVSAADNDDDVAIISILFFSLFQVCNQLSFLSLLFLCYDDDAER